MTLLPITDALMTFHQKNGNVPMSLEELFPEGLPSEIIAGQGGGPRARSYSIQMRVDQPAGFAYYPKEEKEVLNFHYTGPGFNYCSWHTSSYQWQCSGAL